MAALGFLIKKLVSRLIFPLGLSLVLGLAGILLWRLKPASRLGPALALAGWLCLLVFSLPLTGTWLLSTLEQAAGSYASPDALRQAGVSQVVVLGGGVEQGSYTSIDRLSRASLKRVLEGIRLWRQLPEAKLVLSGGNYEPGVLEGPAMAEFAQQAGVPPKDLVLEDASWDTEDQATLLKPILGDRPFALVTSAFHMRRALAMLEDRGLHPIPAPTDFASREFIFSYRLLLPSAAGLRMSEVAIYEYVGMTWRWVKRQLGVGQEQVIPSRRGGKSRQVAGRAYSC